MVRLDWSQCPAVEFDPEKHHGDLVFRDTRLPVALVLECLADNARIDDLIDWYGVNPDQLRQVLKFIAASLAQPSIDPDPAGCGPPD